MNAKFKSSGESIRNGQTVGNEFEDIVNNITEKTKALSNK